MEITILFFGMLSDVTSVSSLTLENLQSTDEVNTLLQKQFPELTNKSYRIAVNEQLIQTNTLLRDGDKIALLPPFSGG